MCNRGVESVYFFGTNSNDDSLGELLLKFKPKDNLHPIVKGFFLNYLLQKTDTLTLRNFPLKVEIDEGILTIGFRECWRLKEYLMNLEYYENCLQKKINVLF